LPFSPLLQLRNTDHNPLALRLRGTVGWEFRDFWASTSVNFQGGYTNIDTAPTARVGSWTTVDASLGYTISSHAFAPVQDFQIRLSGQNIFNASPPFVVNTAQALGYDQENANVLGRLATIQLRVHW